MACEEYPQLEISPYLDMLDNMAEVAAQHLLPSDSADPDGHKDQHSPV